MTISLPLYARLLLLVGISALSGCMGFIFGCCVRMAKRSVEQDGGISCKSCAGGEKNCEYCKMFGLYSAYKRRKGPPEEKRGDRQNGKYIHQ